MDVCPWAPTAPLPPLPPHLPAPSLPPSLPASPPPCPLPPSLSHLPPSPPLQVGRRLTGVTILSGSVVRIWDSLERVLTRHEMELSKSDRGLRIVRVELGGGALPLIGVRYPAHLLGEVVAALNAAQQAGGAAAGGAPLLHRHTGERWRRAVLPSRAGPACWPGRSRTARMVPACHPASVGCCSGQTLLRCQSSMPPCPAPPPARLAAEAPTPVDPKCLHKAFAAPRTVLDFFKPQAAVGGRADGTADGTAAGTSPAAAGTGPAHKRPAPTAAAPVPLTKRPAAAAAAAVAARGTQGGIMAVLARQPPQPPQPGRAAPAPSHIIDLAVGAGSKGASGAAAPGIAAAVLKASAAGNSMGASAAAVVAAAAAPAAAVKRSSGGGGSGGGKSGGGGRYVPDGQSVAALTAMGFSAAQVERALRATQGNLERAANWLLTGS